MALKPNIRSIRFSDELAELINQQVGDTFTQKFENLVTRCVWELPQKEEQLKKINETIQVEQTMLLEMRKRSTELKRSLHTLKLKMQELDGVIKREIDNVIQRQI